MEGPLFAVMESNASSGASWRVRAYFEKEKSAIRYAEQEAETFPRVLFGVFELRWTSIGRVVVDLQHVDGGR